MNFCNNSVSSFLLSQRAQCGSLASSCNPTSLIDCLDEDGKLNVDSYRRLLSDENDQFALQQASLAAAIRECIAEEESSSDEDYVGRRIKKKRNSKAVVWCTDEDGV